MESHNIVLASQCPIVSCPIFQCLKIANNPTKMLFIQGEVYQSLNPRAVHLQNVE